VPRDSCVRGESAGGSAPALCCRRFARTERTRWQPTFLVIGILVLVIGLMLRSSVAVVSGMLVAGSAAPDMGLHSPTAAAVRTWMWLQKNRADNP
jgi:hypothetical protein